MHRRLEPMEMRGLQRGHGFTVVELMIVVAIVAMLAVIAAPSFSNMIKATRIKGVASNLHMSMLKARSEAVKRNASVRVERTGATWGADGWRVVVVSDGTVLSRDPRPESVTVTNADNPANITYLRSGRIQGNPPAAFQVTPQSAITLASARTDRCRSIAIGASGIPSVNKADCPPP